MNKIWNYTLIFLGATLFSFISNTEDNDKIDKLLHKLNMVGIRMVYQPKPINLDNIKKLLDEASEIFDTIQDQGNKQEKQKACKSYTDIRRLYKKRSLETKYQKEVEETGKTDEPPPALLSQPL